MTDQIADLIGPIDLLLDAATVALRLNGKVYNVRKMTMLDLAELQASMKSKFKRPMAPQEIFNELTTPEGITFVLWNRLKETEPTLTLKDVQKLIPATQDALLKLLTMLGIELQGGAGNPPIIPPTKESPSA